MDNENEIIQTPKSFFEKIISLRRHPDGSLLIMALLCLAEILSLGMILHNTGRFRFLLTSTAPGIIFLLLIVFGAFVISWIIYSFWRHKQYAKIASLIFLLILFLLVLLHLLSLRAVYQQNYLEGSGAIQYREHMIAVLVIASCWLPALAALLFIIPDKLVEK